VYRSGVLVDFLRRFYRLLYNEFAWTYDLVAWMVSFGQWKSWTRTVIPYVDNGNTRILELAQGPGHLLVAMARHGLNPVGIDLSPFMCRQASRTTRKSNVQVPIVRARAQALPFRNNSFDSSVATFPTEFILDPATLREVARVVREPPPHVGGYSWQLAVVGWVRFDQSALASRFLSWLYRVTGQGEPVSGIGHEVLERTGFESRVTASRVGHNDVVLIMARQKEKQHLAPSGALW